MALSQWILQLTEDNSMLSRSSHTLKSVIQSCNGYQVDVHGDLRTHLRANLRVPKSGVALLDARVNNSFTTWVLRALSIQYIQVTENENIDKNNHSL
jgi:hypothetical protein